jgi:hypothetical protein
MHKTTQNKFKELPTVAMNEKIDDGGVESLMKRIADKEGREDGRASESKAWRSILAEPAQIKLHKTVKDSGQIMRVSTHCATVANASPWPLVATNGLLHLKTCCCALSLATSVSLSILP